MHFYWNPGVLQRNVVNQRIVDTVHWVILGLQQESRGRPAGDGNIRIQLKLLVPEMPRIKGHCEIRAAASLSAASTVGYKRLSKCVLISATRCPPAENPSTPILCGSIWYSAARKRTSPNVLCASSSAIGAFGFI